MRGGVAGRLGRLCFCQVLGMFRELLFKGRPRALTPFLLSPLRQLTVEHSRIFDDPVSTAHQLRIINVFTSLFCEILSSFHLFEQILDWCWRIPRSLHLNLIFSKVAFIYFPKVVPEVVQNLECIYQEELCGRVLQIRDVFVFHRVEDLVAEGVFDGVMDVVDFYFIFPYADGFVDIEDVVGGAPCP